MLLRKITGILIVLTLATASYGAEFEVKPSLAVSEEYTDNVFDTNSKVSDFITRAMPSITMLMKSPVLTGDLSYQFDYRYYARHNLDDEMVHVLAAKGILTLVDNLLFVEMSDAYQRVSLDVTRDVTTESLAANQTDRNVFTVSPYLLLRASSTTMAKTGYRFIDTHYFDSIGIDKMEHTAFAEAIHEFSSSWKGLVGYNFVRMDAGSSNSYNQQKAYAGFRYEYADKSFFSAQGGRIWTDFDNQNSQRNLYWNVALSYFVDNVTATLSSELRFTEDPKGTASREKLNSIKVEKALAKGSAGLECEYSEFANNENGVTNTRKIAGRVNWHNEITSLLKGNVTFAAERYQYPLQSTYTRRFLVESSINYQLAEQLTTSLSYIFVDYYSPGIVTDNRTVNRIMLELKKSF